MKTAERVFGFASCALGLLPLLGEQVKAQQSGPISCQNVATLTASGTTTLPVLLNPAATRVVICGYSIVDLGPTTQGATLVYGGGSACAAILGFTTQTAFSPTVTGPTAAGAAAYLARSGLGLSLPASASICVNSTITSASVEINYSLN